MHDEKHSFLPHNLFFCSVSTDMRTPRWTFRLRWIRFCEPKRWLCQKKLLIIHQLIFLKLSDCSQLLYSWALAPVYILSPAANLKPFTQLNIIPADWEGEKSSHSLFCTIMQIWKASFGPDLGLFQTCKTKRAKL